jgi:precorrin isomerase
MATVEFMIYSTLTLIYKVVSATWMTSVPEPIRYTPECIEAARNTLRSLNKAWEEVSTSKDDYFKLFLNW